MSPLDESPSDTRQSTYVEQLAKIPTDVIEAVEAEMAKSRPHVDGIVGVAMAFGVSHANQLLSGYDRAVALLEKAGKLDAFIARELSEGDIKNAQMLANKAELSILPETYRKAAVARMQQEITHAVIGLLRSGKGTARAEKLLSYARTYADRGEYVIVENAFNVMEFADEKERQRVHRELFDTCGESRRNSDSWRLAVECFARTENLTELAAIATERADEFDDFATAAHAYDCLAKILSKRLSAREPLPDLLKVMLQAAHEVRVNVGGEASATNYYFQRRDLRAELQKEQPEKLSMLLAAAKQAKKELKTTDAEYQIACDLLKPCIEYMENRMEKYRKAEDRRIQRRLFDDEN